MKIILANIPGLKEIILEKFPDIQVVEAVDSAAILNDDKSVIYQKYRGKKSDMDNRQDILIVKSLFFESIYRNIRKDFPEFFAMSEIEKQETRKEISEAVCNFLRGTK